MPIIGTTSEGKKIVQLVVSGPKSYTSPVTVRVEEISYIETANLSLRTNLKVTDFVHVVDYTYTKNEICYRVFRINTTVASPASWVEIPAGDDISDLVLEILVIGI